MSVAESLDGPTNAVEFWNQVLVPKFSKYKHILVGGLSLHSAKVLPALAVRRATACWTWDAGGATPRSKSPDASARPGRCWASTAAGLSRIRRGGREGRRTGQRVVQRRRRSNLSVQTDPRFLFLPLRHAVLRKPRGGFAQHAAAPQAPRHHDMIVWRRSRTIHGSRCRRRSCCATLPPVEKGLLSCGPGPFSMAEPGSGDEAAEGRRLVEGGVRANRRQGPGR